MSKALHRIYIAAFVVITFALTTYLIYIGLSYYKLPLDQRFYHPQYEYFKASGVLGHGLGVIGTLFILFGVVLYITAKNTGFLERIVRLKYVLEFHIFLCVTGPIMVLFHTTFKFGGIISIGFWSMMLVVLSGIIGRYIYIQIPRTISGRELSLKEINESQQSRMQELLSDTRISSDLVTQINSYFNPYPWGLRSFFYNRRQIRQIISGLKLQHAGASLRREVIKSVRSEIVMKQRIQRLATMQRIFKYWHVAHKPFAIIMLVIVTIHVVVTLLLGYRWVF